MKPLTVVLSVSFLISCALCKPSFRAGKKVINGKSFDEIENSLVFQGDMLLRDNTLKRALNGEDVTPEEESVDRGSGPKSSAVGFGKQQMKWGKEIPYTLNKNAKCSFFGRISHWFKSIGNDAHRCHEDAIKEAIKEWENKIGCIKFVAYTGQRDYIEFTSTGYGSCYAHVGRIGGRQVVNIDDGCSAKGTVLHEIGHALGLHHEHSRPDRDNYIEVLWDNIPKDKKFNFKKYSVSEIETVRSKYDYNSIMHYGRDAFAKFGRDSMRPRRGNPTIGQRNKLSSTDIQSVKRYFCEN